MCRGEEVQADLRREDVGGERRVEEVGEGVVEDADSCSNTTSVHIIVVAIFPVRTVSELEIALVQALLLALILFVCAWRRTREPAAAPVHRRLARAHISDVALVLLEAQQPGRRQRSARGSRKLGAG